MTLSCAYPRRRPKALAAVAVLLALLWLWQPLASAHGFVVDISPEPDSVLGEAPREITISFNESVSAGSDAIRVFDPSGRQLGGLRAAVHNKRLSAELPGLDVVGSYTVAWRVVSADGHPINGAFLFSVGKATLIQPLDVAEGGSSTLPRALRVVGTLLGFGALVVLLAWAAIAARARAERRLLSPALALLVAGTVVSFLGALFSVGGSPIDAFRVTLGTTSGRVSLAALLLAVVTAVILWLRLRVGGRVPVGDRRLTVVLLLACAVVIALEGHAFGLSPVLLSALLTPLHVLAALIWLAGLVWIDRRSRFVTVEELRADVSRRSPYAMVVVGVLTVTGITLFAVRMPLADLVSSAYGILGSIKIILLAMAVVLAWQNRALMRPLPEPTADEEPAADGLEVSHRNALDLHRFRASLRFEIVLVAIALLLGTVLAQVSPPGTEQAGGGFFSAKRPFGTGRVELTIDPGKRGVNEIHVTALGADGRLMADIDNLELQLSLPEKDLGPLQPTLQVITRGHSYTYARVPFAGDWKFTVTATANRFDALSATFDVKIAD